MPIYEYRCPNGHTFELFQRMSDPPAETCVTCGEGPVEKLLFPVAVHFKGKGFYNTDYGTRKRAREKEAADATAGSESKTESSSGDKKDAKETKAKDKPAKDTAKKPATK